MNEKTTKYWNDYWASQTQSQPEEVEAFQFGADADWLASLVVEGKKTGTCSAHIWYEFESEPLPYVGQYNIVLDSKEQPVAIIRVTEVSIMPMNKVPEEFALAEGEGDYEYWWTAHEKFFKSELEAQGLNFSESMLLVCERFETIHTIEMN